MKEGWLAKFSKIIYLKQRKNEVKLPNEFVNWWLSGEKMGVKSQALQ